MTRSYDVDGVRVRRDVPRVRVEDAPAKPSQGVLDALADYETLRRVSLELLVQDETRELARETFHVLGQGTVATAHLRAGHVHMARQTYVAAAHAARQLIPELR